MKHQTFLLSLFILTLLIFSQTSPAQPLLRPGMPDPFFGAGGRVLTEIPETTYYWYNDLALQTDGKVVTLGTGYYFSNRFYYHFIINRYNADGTPDSTFGAGGIKFIPVETDVAENVSGNSIKILPDGKMLIAATIARDFGILRLSPDGEPDNSFGAGGMVRTDFAGFEETSRDFLRGVLIRPDGKIIAYGTSEFDNAINPCTNANPCVGSLPKRHAIAQYNPDGSLDTSFGAGGIQSHRFSNLEDNLLHAALQPDGKLSVAGYYYWLMPYSVLSIKNAFIRFNTDGTLDTSFGKEGFLVSPHPVNSLVVLPDGKLLSVVFCAQYCGLTSNINTKIERYNSDFTPDKSFSAALHVLQTQSLVNVEWQPDGKLLFSTLIHRVGFSDVSILYRFNSDGSADFSFGTNGAVTVDLDGSSTVNSSATKTITQPDGKILIGSIFYQASGATAPKGIVIMRLLGKNSKRGL